MFRTPLLQIKTHFVYPPAETILVQKIPNTLNRSVLTPRFHSLM
jgi:hypothetical protein